MFVTLPAFEEAGMSAVAGNGQKYWRALAADFPVQPWYLFVFKATRLDTRVNQTMLVSWEESLLDIVDSVPVVDHRSVYRVEPTSSGELALREVRTMWAPTASETGQGIGAVFGLDESGALVDAALRPVIARAGRRLVYCSTRVDAGESWPRAAHGQAH